MKSLMVVAAIVGLLALIATAGASPKGAKVRIDFSRSSCLQMADQNEGEVRFFVQLVNSGNSAGAFRSDIHFVWLRGGDGWKDSWMNVIEHGQLKVRAHARKRYYTDFGADPSKLIVACGLKIGSSSSVHRIKVLY